MRLVEIGVGIIAAVVLCIIGVVMVNPFACFIGPITAGFLIGRFIRAMGWFL